MSAFSLYPHIVKFTRVLSHVLLLASLLSAVAVAAPPEWIEGQLIVKPRAGLSDEQFKKILSKSKGQSVKHLRQINTHVIKVPPQALDAVMRALSNNPHIDYVEKGHAGGTRCHPAE